MKCIINKIQIMIKEADFLVHNFFDLENDKVYTDDILYDMNEFSKYKMTNKEEYILILDRNIFDYLIKSQDKNNLNHKNAISLILYCQYLNINIEPNLAISETFIRSKNKNEANKELTIFRQIDSRKQELVDFICGDNHLRLSTDQKIQTLPDNFFKYKNPSDWSLLHLSILVLTNIFYNPNIERKDKFKTFLDWIDNEFIIIIPVFVYAIFLFDRESHKGIMKFNRKTKNNTIKDLENMIWDLYIIKTYYEKLSKKENNTEYLFASNDKLLKKMLKVCIKISYCNTENIDMKNKQYVNNCIDSIINLKKRRDNQHLPKLDNVWINSEIIKYTKKLNI